MQSKNEVIESIAGVIKTKFNPEKIILFGSYAYGTPKDESDIDLLVIMNTTLPVREQAYLIRRELSNKIPMDIIVRTPSQVEQRFRMGDFFMKKIVQSGVLL